MTEAADPRRALSDARGWISVAAAVFVLLGVLLRLARYLAGRSLWGDEAALALAIWDAPFGELLGPLGYRQAAPPAYLLAVKSAASLFGYGEAGLRLVSLVSGLLALPLFWGWVRRVLSTHAALLALLLFAVAEPLVYYSSELKQYSTDVLVTTALLFLSTVVLVEGSSRRRLAGLALLGTLGVWFSHVAVFACAASGTVLVLETWRRRGVAAAGVPAGICALWAISFLAEYRLVLVSTGSLEFLRFFWRDGFAPFPPTSLVELLWYPRTLLGVVGDPLAIGPPWLGALALVAGVTALAVRVRIRSLAICLLPIALAVVASGLELFPFATNGQDPVIAASPELYHPALGRVILFTVPCWTALVAAAAAWAARYRSPAWRVLVWAMLVVLTLPPVGGALWRLVRPPDIHDVGGLVSELQESHEPHETVWIQTFGREVVHYHARHRGWEPSTRDIRLHGGGDARKIAISLGSLPPGTRYWIVTVHHPRWGSEAEQAAILGVLDRSARRIDRIDRYRATAVRFERHER